MSRRRRRHLQVTTFPFIAVLLCAMGSLILLLMVLDRRAKLVAQAKAAQSIRDVEETTKEQQRILAEQEAEWQRRQQELHAFLLQEEQAVLTELNKTNTKTSQVEQELQSKQLKNIALTESVLQEQARLEKLKLDLQQKQVTLNQTKQETGKVNQELIKLEADLVQLELALQNLKKLKAQQQRTYSVVPYKGKSGDNRKPHYIECVAEGVIFHPDRRAFTGPAFSALQVRKELDSRIQARQASQPEEAKQKKPYLFLLVRPEGLDSYYAMQAAVAGLKIDFGYELVDGDWLLDFSEDGKFGPAGDTPVVAAIPQGTGGPGKKVQGHQNMAGITGQGKSPSPPEGNHLTPGSGLGMKVPSFPGSSLGTTTDINKGNSSSPGGSGSGPLVHEPIWKPSKSGLGSGKGISGGIPNSAQEKISGLSPDTPNKPGGVSRFPPRVGTGTPNIEKDTEPGTTFIAPPIPAGATKGNPQVVSGKPGQTGDFTGNKEGGNQKSEPGSGPPATGSGKEENASAKGQPTSGNSQGNPTQISENPGGENTPNEESVPAFLPAYGPLKKAPPKGFIPHSRLVGNRDWNINLDCNGKGLELRLTNQLFSLDMLKSAFPGEHPLRKAVRELIAEKQATVRPGEFPYRPALRFEVLPEGLRAYLLAYSILEDLRLPVIRHNIEPHVPTLEDYYRKK